MSIALKEPEQLLPVPGIRLGVTRAGIRYPDRDDLVLMEIDEGSRAGAVFTTNAFRAAPVNLAHLHLAQAAPRYLLINSGNANAGTGDRGLADAVACCREVAEQTGCDVRTVLPFSTGVIGEHLPVHDMRQAIPRAVAQLDEHGWLKAAKAIMTTDTNTCFNPCLATSCRAVVNLEISIRISSADNPILMPPMISSSILIGVATSTMSAMV